MKISGIIRKLRKTGNQDLIKYALAMEHMNHKGFFGPYLEKIESAKFNQIQNMLENITDAIDPDYGVETGQILRAAFIGFNSGRNGKRRSKKSRG